MVSNKKIFIIKNLLRNKKALGLDPRFFVLY